MGGGEEGEIRAWASKCKLSKESGTKKIEPIPFEGAVPVSRPSCSTTAYATKRLTIRTRYAVWKSVRPFVKESIESIILLSNDANGARLTRDIFVSFKERIQGLVYTIVLRYRDTIIVDKNCKQ